MEKFKRPVVYVFIILISLLLLYAINNSSIVHGVDETKAVELAKKYCTQDSIHLTSKKQPLEFKAELLTCDEIKGKTSISECSYLAPAKKAWLVSTDGQWFLWGPPTVQGVASAPITLTGCYVVIDAVDGTKLDINWK